MAARLARIEELLGRSWIEDAGHGDHPG